MATEGDNQYQLIGDDVVDRIFQKISSQEKIDRESGLAELSRILKGLKLEDEGGREGYDKVGCRITSSLEDILENRDDKDKRTVDQKLGCLSAAVIFLSASVAYQNEGFLERSAKKLELGALKLLSDNDVRVRVLAGEILGLLCKIFGLPIFTQFKDELCDLLKVELGKSEEVENIMRESETVVDPVGEMAPTEPHVKLNSPQLGPSPVTTPSGNPNLTLSEVLKAATSALKDHKEADLPMDAVKNVGSANLESILRCFQFIAKGLGEPFGTVVDREMLNLIFKSLHNQNRFIREASFGLCAVLIDCGLDIGIFGKSYTEEISMGLSDICSQARIASASGCRKLMLKLNQQEREEYLPLMLPKLCLSRYYMADTKFLLYSQESWKMIFGTAGPQLVAKYIEEIISYYVQASESENHAVREAACSCFGELACKMDPAILTSRLPVVMNALKRCFNDERWHVRDAACLATGNFLKHYPSECRDQLDNLLQLMGENLGFPISIVRQGAAAAFSNCARGYGIEVVPNILDVIVKGLQGIENQKAETCKNVDLPEISPEIKYSYPPEMGAQYIPYARPSYPWELGDGCLYLIGDIAQVPEFQSELTNLIPKILKAAQFRSYSQHVVILETCCKILPWVVKGVGKRPFKDYLSQFFEIIFYSIECGNSLTSGAGRVCLHQLAEIYGPNIIRSRIEMYDPRFANYIEPQTNMGLQR